MAPKEKRPSSSFYSASEYPQPNCPYYDDDDENDDEDHDDDEVRDDYMFDSISMSSASLTGTDTEYKYGSESYPEIVSANRAKNNSKKTKSKKADAADHHASNAKADKAKLKRKSSERNGGDSDVAKKKIKGRLAHNNCVGVGIARSTTTVQKTEDSTVLDEAFDNYLKSLDFDHRWIKKGKRGSLVNKWRQIKVVESRFRYVKANMDIWVNRWSLYTFKKLDYFS